MSTVQNISDDRSAVIPGDSNGGDIFTRYNTTTVNLSLGLPGMYSTFTSIQLRRLRILAIMASVASILAGVIGLQLVTAIDRRRKVFRHHMLLFLIVFDLLKAVVLLVYPVVILIDNSVYGTPSFFNVVGWLTAYAIEGADIVIVIFAIHFALLIFKPTWKWVNPTTGNVEGGVYRWRKFMYPLAGLLPMIIASLAFVDYNKLHEYNDEQLTIVLDNNNYYFPQKPRVGGYKPMSAWCYLPPYPYWYTLVLSWGPRYLIFISICGIYVSIYVYVSRQSQKIKTDLGEFHVGAGPWGKKTDRLQDNSKRKGPSTPAQKCLSCCKYCLDQIGPIALFHSIKNFFFLAIDDDQSDTDMYDSHSDDEDKPYDNDIKALKYENENIPTGKMGRTVMKRRTSQKPWADDLFNTQSKSFNLVKQFQTDVSRDQPLMSPNEQADYGAPKPNPVTGNSISALGLYANSLHRSSFGNEPLNDGLSGHFDGKRYPKRNIKKPAAARRSSVRKSLGISDKESNINSTVLSPITSPSKTSSNYVDDNMFHHSSAVNSHDFSLEHPLKYGQNTLYNQNGSMENILSSAALTDVHKDFQGETYKEFKMRRNQIKKQLKSIFIYPFAYLILWIFPFIVDCTQFHYELREGPIVWLAYIATFMQPLSCVVDVLVFSYREKPWRYSWASIQRKELINQYILKGELGEQTIMELVKSGDGRKGWYYRGKWMKLECWKHKPQRWKRICWYVCRFVKGLFLNDYSFSDNCNDYTYWDNYYTLGSRPAGNPSPSKDNNAPTGNNTTSVVPSSDIIKIPIWWRIIHFYPMLGGIDLDELDRDLRLKSQKNDLRIPGLQMALGNRSALQTPDPTTRRSSSIQTVPPPIFKSDYSMKRNADEEQQSLATFGKKSSAVMSQSLENSGPVPKLSAHMDFSDVTNTNQPGVSNPSESDRRYLPEDADRQIDLLSFLNG